MSFGNVTGATSMMEENRLLLAQIYRMKAEHKAELQALTSQTEAMIQQYKLSLEKEYQGKSSSQVYDLNIKIEKMKLEHQQAIISLKEKHEKEKAEAVAKAISACQLSCKQQIDRMRSDYELQIANLKKSYNELKAQFNDSQYNLMKSEQLIVQIKETHAKALAEEKAIVNEAQKTANQIQDAVDEKKARNKKLAMGGAGLVGAYLMFKE